MHEPCGYERCFPCIFCDAIPDSPVQSLDFRDDHGLSRHLLRIAGRQGASDLLKMLKSHSDKKPIENRRFSDAGIGESAPKSGTTIGAGRQFGVFRSADAVEVPADQHPDVRVGFGDGAEDMPATELRFDIANPHLQMKLPILVSIR